ncbi:MAG TPA: hypothetical protein VLS86_01710 [Acidimicrobiia bacterium]|nr:hypothetical protein [Acidimicrobiia bacterium]
MKFTGQVRVPEIDHPGVPATILVEDGQTEIFLEGESLGRWSLYDVRADRLVSSAFSLSLHGEEITFIADEPVDFAYKGVDHMAEVWARYKSMAMPRRALAVGKSRRGTLPSRIGELRTAMLQNLEAAGRGMTVLPPIETVRGPLAKYTAQPSTREARPATPPVTEKVVAPPPSEPLFRPSPVEEAPSTPEVAATAAPSPPPRLRPGPGLVGRTARPATEPLPADSAEAAESEEALESVFASPEVTTPVLRSPWDEPALPDDHEEPVPVEVFAPESVEDQAPQDPVVQIEPDPVLEEGAELVEAPLAEEVIPPAAPAEMPELVKELLSTSTDEAGEEGARDLVVDLGPYEARGRRDTGPVAPPTSSPSPKEPAMAAAVPPDKSGLMGAVRSAFARNKVAHEHQFVEAPGGIGIVRQICAECGYISIGLSD